MIWPTANKRKYNTQAEQKQQTQIKLLMLTVPAGFAAQSR